MFLCYARFYFTSVSEKKGRTYRTDLAGYKTFTWCVWGKSHTKKWMQFTSVSIFPPGQLDYRFCNPGCWPQVKDTIRVQFRSFISRSVTCLCSWKCILTELQSVSSWLLYSLARWTGQRIIDSEACQNKIHFQASVIQRLIVLFLYQSTCCGYSKELSQWDNSFEHPKQMFKWDKNMFITPEILLPMIDFWSESNTDVMAGGYC